MYTSFVGFNISVRTMKKDDRIEFQTGRNKKEKKNIE